MLLLYYYIQYIIIIFFIFINNIQIEQQWCSITYYCELFLLPLGTFLCKYVRSRAVHHKVYAVRPLAVQVFNAGKELRSGQACVLQFHQRGGDFFVQNSPILPTVSLTACRRNWPIAASPVGQASFGGQWPVRPLTSCCKEVSIVPIKIARFGTCRVRFGSVKTCDRRKWSHLFH